MNCVEAICHMFKMRTSAPTPFAQSISKVCQAFLKTDIDLPSPLYRAELSYMSSPNTSDKGSLQHEEVPINEVMLDNTIWHKFDWRILPVAAMFYFLSFLVSFLAYHQCLDKEKLKFHFQFSRIVAISQTPGSQACKKT